MFSMCSYMLLLLFLSDEYVRNIHIKCNAYTCSCIVLCLPLFCNKFHEIVSIQCFVFASVLTSHAISTIYNLTKTPVTAKSSCRPINYAWANSETNFRGENNFH